MAKKIKKYRVGTDSETYAISMVEMPAIEEDFVALARQEEEQVFLQKDEKHMVYGAVLVPDKDIYRNDGEKEYYLSFTSESIEKMSQDFMKEYRQHEITVDHEDIANEVCVVESWIKADLFKDKSVALGLNEQLPVGTWFCGMKVNNIDTWERIRKGELKGFSVESMISLEEFGKQNNDNMIETNDTMFWDKLKNVLKDVFSSASIEKEVEETEEKVETELEEEPAPTEPQPTVVVEEPKVEEPKVEEPKVEEPKAEGPKVEEPKVDNSHLEDLVASLKEEIEALKEMNSGLQSKIKDLGKQPSAEPIKPTAKPSAADTYASWREQMRGMLG